MKKFSTILSVLLGLVALGTVNSCKDYDDDMYANLNSKFQEVVSGSTTLIEIATQQIETLEAQNQELNKKQEELKDSIEKIMQQIGKDSCSCAGKYVLLSQYKSDSASIASTLKTLTDAKNKLDSVFNNVTNNFGTSNIYDLLLAVINSHNDLVKAGGTIDAINKGINGIRDTIKIFNSTLDSLALEVTKAQNDAAAALGLAKYDSTMIAKLDSIIKVQASQLAGHDSALNAHDSIMNKIIDSLSNYVTNETFKNKIDSVCTVANNLYNKSTHYTDSVCDVLKNRIDSIGDTLTIRLNDIENAYMKADSVLMDSIKQHRQELNQLSKTVNDISATITSLTGRVDNIQDELKRQIFGIVLQGCTTPVLGDININLGGIESTWLCAYVGNWMTGKKFPTTSAAGLIGDASEIFTAAEQAEAGITNEDPRTYNFMSNAGKVYVTLNPAGTTDFTNTTLDLVDSRGDKSGIALTPLKPSDKLIKAGIGRSVENGFYEAEAIVNNAEKAKISFSDLKNIAKDAKTILKDHKYKQGLVNMAKDVMKSAAAHASVTGYALSASYTDADGNKKSVYSKYNIAATAITPLSYNVSERIAGVDFQKYKRHLPYLSEKFDKILGTIQGKMFFKFDEVEFKADSFDINIKGLTFEPDKEYINVLVKVSYDKPISYDKETNKFTFEAADTTINVKVKGEELADIAERINDKIISSMNDQFLKLNSKFKGIQTNLVAEINKALKNTADMINTKVEDVVKYLSDYVHKTDRIIDKVNNLVDKVFAKLDNAEMYFQPTMFYVDSQNNYNLMSSFRKHAGYVNAGFLNLYATSYTMELINPAYKKLVAVKDLTTGSWVKEGNLNQVVDGTNKKFGFNLESGHEYEIIYCALDYKSYQTVQRYYINAK